MTVRVRPTYQEVSVLEIDQRGDDWFILIEYPDGSEVKVPEGMIIADGGIGEVVRSAKRIIR